MRKAVQKYRKEKSWISDDRDEPYDQNLSYSLPLNLLQLNPRILAIPKPLIMWDSNSPIVYFYLIFCDHI